MIKKIIVLVRVNISNFRARRILYLYTNLIDHYAFEGTSALLHKESPNCTLDLAGSKIVFILQKTAKSPGVNSPELFGLS